VKWLSVGKTIVPYGQGESQFVLIGEDPNFPVSQKATLPELAAAIRANLNSVHDQEVRCIKNDLPALVWFPKTAGPLDSDVVLECERLSKDEMHELAKLIR